MGKEGTVRGVLEPISVLEWLPGTEGDIASDENGVIEVEDGAAEPDEGGSIDCCP